MIGSWVCVVGIVSNTIYYSGKLASKAAKELDPGTCYGWGLTELEAQAMAHDEARRFRAKERAAA